VASIQSDYYNTQQYKNAQALQNQTIAGLSKQYGFDFSQGYANNQAETAAQAQRLAQQSAARDNQSMHDLTMQQILDNYNTGAKALDQNYFKNYMNQAQSQVNRGLSGGMVADQNTRLAMNKQGEVAGLWRDRNQSSMQENARYGNTTKTINDALAQIEKEKAANAQKMYQDLLSQAYGILSSDRSYGLQLDNSQWGKYQDMFSNDMAIKNYNLSKSRAAAASAAAVNFKGSGANNLNTALANYQSAKPSVSAGGSLNTPLDKYYSNPVIQAAQATGSPYFSNPLPPAQNPYLSAYDKMKMLGL
jgi:hypothetical protein